MPKGLSNLETRYRQEIEDCFKSVDINSREELQELADEEDININWDKWNYITEITKQDITKQLSKLPRKVYVYDLQGNHIATYDSPKIAGFFYGISSEQVNNYMRQEKPYLKQGVLFLDHEVEKKRNHPKWVYKIEYKLIGHYPSAREAEKALGINRNTINNYAKSNKFYKQKLYFTNQPL